MGGARDGIVRLDATGVLRPVGASAAQWLRERQGLFRLEPGPKQALLLLACSEDGTFDTTVQRLRLAGRVTAAGELHEVLWMVASGDARSELVFVDDDRGVRRSLFLDGPNLVGATSDCAPERIGEIMRRHGALTQAQHEAVLHRMKGSPGRLRFGEVAVELGFLGRERLFELTALQLEEIFFGALFAKAGAFYLFSDFEEARIAAHHDLPIPRLLGEGLSRVDELAYFRRRVPSLDHVPERLPRREAPPELAPVLALCDGARSVGDIVAASSLSEFEATRAIYRLVEAGAARVLGPRPRNLEAAVLAFNRAMQPLFEVAHAHGVRRRLEEQLTEFVAGAGPYDALFHEAGPREDGTLDVARAARNAERLAGPDPRTALTDWLHDYASFAFFALGASLPKDQERELARRVRSALRPLTPSVGRRERTSSRPPAGERPKLPVALPADMPPIPEPAVPRAARPPVEVEKPKAKDDAVEETPVDESGPARAGAPPGPGGAVVDGPASVEDSASARAAAPSAPDTAPALERAVAPVAAKAQPRPRRRGVGLLLVASVALAAGTALYLRPRERSPIPSPPAPSAVVAVTASAGPRASAAPSTPRSLAPPTSSASTPEATIASASAAPITTTATTSVASAAPSTSPKEASLAHTEASIDAVPADRTRLRTRGQGGFRLFVDGHLVGNTPGPFLVACGAHVVKVGSAGRDQSLDLPCGGELTVGRVP